MGKIPSSEEAVEGTILRPWSGEDHSVGEGKRASQEGSYRLRPWLRWGGLLPRVGT